MTKDTFGGLPKRGKWFLSRNMVVIPDDEPVMEEFTSGRNDAGTNTWFSAS